MKKIWKAENISIKLKVRIFKASCITVLLYGSETWIIPPEKMQVLDSFATSCYRIMLNVKKHQHITNAEIYRRAGEQPLSKRIITQQLTWVGHMLRRDEEEPIRIYALYYPKSLGKKKQVRQALDFCTYVSDLRCSTLTLTEDEIVKTASDRAQWK